MGGDSTSPQHSARMPRPAWIQHSNMIQKLLRNNRARFVPCCSTLLYVKCFPCNYFSCPLSFLLCLLSLVSLSFPRLSLAATLPARPQPKGYKGGIFRLNVIDVFDQEIGKARVCAYPWNIDLFNR